jgi:predicted DNA-binding protein YlxM (UPF0122 family)
VPEKTVRVTMLFDFFGETLTEKQREYFDLYYNEDFSLAEIAENYGVTRQCVYDALSRAYATLDGMEEKTGAVRRFESFRDGLAEAIKLAEGLSGLSPRGEAADAAQALVSALRELKGQVM